MRAQLAEAAAASLREAGSVLLLGGEAGSGKTTLATMLSGQIGVLVVCEERSVTGRLPQADRRLLTFRPEEVELGRMAAFVCQIREPRRVTELTIPPLALAEVTAWAGPEKARELHELTGGN